MGEIYVSPREIVVPGDLLANGLDVIAGDNTYRIGEKVVSKVVGLADVQGRVIRVIALEGAYSPKVGDRVIGRIVDVGFSNWLVDINSPYYANLPVGEAVEEYLDLLHADLSAYYDVGDVIFAEVINVTRRKMVQLSVKKPGLGKLEGGRLIDITPKKVPRVIGKKASMITMLKQMTGCEILVGNNGIIWIKGDPMMERIVVEAIHIIEEESHIKGLTEKIKAFLEKKIAEVKGNEV